jgi:hypothetical protein
MALERATYPIRLRIDYPERLSRLTTLLRFFWLIPIYVVYFAIGAIFTGGGERGADLFFAVLTGGASLFLAPLLMILFRRKYPRWWFDWNLEVTRFGTRIGAYTSLLRDEYPSTDEHQAVHLDIDYPDVTQLRAALREATAANEAAERKLAEVKASPEFDVDAMLAAANELSGARETVKRAANAVQAAERGSDLSRWLPLVKWLLAIPHYIVLFFLAIAALFAIIIAWFAVMFTARYPRGLFDFVVGVTRWSLRVSGYAFLLVTDRYPPFRLGE